MNFTLTPAAQKFMRMMLRADGTAGSGFRLAVSPGGCSGLAADISVLATPQPGDAVVADADGVRPDVRLSAGFARFFQILRRQGIAIRAARPRSARPARGDSPRACRC